MKTRNKSYWKKRTTALEQSIQDGATPSVNNIIRAYERAIDNINGDIRKVFREFSRASGISEEQAAEIISQSESDELYTDLLKLLDETEDAQLRADIITKINSQAYGARISRLEALKRKVYIRLKQAQNVEMSQHNALHKETLKSSYYSNIYNIAKGFDVGIDFSLLPDNAIKKVLSETWLGSNYSKRIWNNNEQFIERVQQTIEDGITGGHSISRMADRLEEYVKVPNQGQRYIVERLARSETAHFMAQGQLMSYEEVGIEKYQYVAALSERTCDTCGGLDGETFDVKDARPGDNYPPMHANCRCTTIMAGFPPATRIARDPETGKNYKVDGNMTFNEWKNGLTDEQRKAMELHVRQMKNKSADKKQYEKYISVIGKENMPKTFDAFQDLKYNDIKQWGLLKDYKQSRSSNMISAFTSFDDYKIYKQKINDELIGIITSDGVEIKSQSKHFIERVFGTSEDPNTKRPRNGVEIEDIKDALLNGTKKHRKDSLRYFGDKCVVSVNKNSGILIQTNPK